MSSQVDLCPQRCLEVNFAFRALGPPITKGGMTDHPPPPPSHCGWAGRPSLCVPPSEGREGTGEPGPGLSATGPLLARGASGSQRDHPPNLPRRREPSAPTGLRPQEIPSPSHCPLKTLPPHTHTSVPGFREQSWMPGGMGPGHLSTAATPERSFPRALTWSAHSGRKGSVGRT